MPHHSPLTLSFQTQSSSTIVIQTGVLSRITDYIDSAKWSSIHVVCDQSVSEDAREIAKNLGTTHIITVENAESAKSFDGLATVCQELAQQQADRHSLVVNVGGGALCDLGGLAASIYMRGISFVQIPTTLLAQVDASIGGKTAINAFHIKNIIGSFAQPELVIIDPAVLTHLPKNQLASGCAEMLKHGLIKDRNYWNKLASHNLDTLFSSSDLLESVIYESCVIKHAVVAVDEHETGERKKLNFGHTIGHAIEAISHNTNEPYLHGEAVALGMIAESKLSKLDNDSLQQISSVISAYGLPITLRLQIDPQDILEKMKADKKNKAGTIHWTLLRSIGDSVYDQAVAEADVVSAIEMLQP